MIVMRDYHHWCWGSNNLREDVPNYLINLEYAVSIRFEYGLSEYCSYKDFYSSIADIQFLTGTRPGENEIEKIKMEAWNYLCLEERELDNHEF